MARDKLDWNEICTSTLIKQKTAKEIRPIENVGPNRKLEEGAQM